MDVEGKEGDKEGEEEVEEGRGVEVARSCVAVVGVARKHTRPVLLQLWSDKMEIWTYMISISTYITLKHNQYSCNKDSMG